MAKGCHVLAGAGPVTKVKPFIDNRRSLAGGATVVFIVVLAALLGLSAWLYADRSRKEAELARLRPLAAEAATHEQERAELEQLRAQASQLAQLQRDNQELIKLRGEVATLRPLQAQAQKAQNELQQLRASLEAIKN